MNRIERLEKMLAMAEKAGMVDEATKLRAEIQREQDAGDPNDRATLARLELRAMIQAELGGEPESRAMTRPQGQEIDFPVSAVSHSMSRYGPETPQQAEERWREQEQRDPDGVYGIGGASAGGIFGDGTVAMGDYDPAARGRTGRS